MTVISDLLLQRPINSVGAPTGYGDWRIGVEMALPTGATPSQWGTALWGTAEWADPEWVDMTDRVRGMEWQRGADDFGGRPTVGEALITFTNTDRSLSPIDPTNSLYGLVTADGNGDINSNYYGPGTVVRIVAHSPTGYGPDVATADDEWVPLFTGYVESWNEIREELERESYVEVSIVETIAKMSLVDEIALTSTVGSNDDVYERVQTLGDAAGWPYGYMDGRDGMTYGTSSLQSTVMAGNRLSELYLSGDSVGAWVSTDRCGAIIVYPTGSATLDRGPLQKPVLMAHPRSVSALSGALDYDLLTTFVSTVPAGVVRLNDPTIVTASIAYVNAIDRHGVDQSATLSALPTSSVLTFQLDGLDNVIYTTTGAPVESQPGVWWVPISHDAGSGSVQADGPFTLSIGDVVDVYSAVQIDPEGLTVEVDDWPIINSVQLARSGGTVAVATDTASIAKYGKRTFKRTDLITTSSTPTAALAGQMVVERSDLTIRIKQATMDGLADVNAIGAAISLAPKQVLGSVYMTAGDGGSVEFPSAVVDSVVHSVTPVRNDLVHWRCDVVFGVVGTPNYQAP